MPPAGVPNALDRCHSTRLSTSATDSAMTRCQHSFLRYPFPASRSFSKSIQERGRKQLGFSVGCGRQYWTQSVKTDSDSLSALSKAPISERGEPSLVGRG